MTKAASKPPGKKRLVLKVGTEKTNATRKKGPNADDPGSSMGFFVRKKIPGEMRAKGKSKSPNHRVNGLKKQDGMAAFHKKKKKQGPGDPLSNSHGNWKWVRAGVNCRLRPLNEEGEGNRER